MRSKAAIQASKAAFAEARPNYVGPDGGVEHVVLGRHAVVDGRHDDGPVGVAPSQGPADMTDPNVQALRRPEVHVASYDERRSCKDRIAGARGQQRRRTTRSP